MSVSTQNKCIIQQERNKTAVCIDEKLFENYTRLVRRMRNNKWDTQTNNMAECYFPTKQLSTVSYFYLSPSTFPHSGNSKNFNVNFKIQSINRSMA